jgi:hypothetical protein
MCITPLLHLFHHEEESCPSNPPPERMSSDMLPDSDTLMPAMVKELATPVGNRYSDCLEKLTVFDQLSPEDDIEFVNRNKARFRRRLQDRWTCQIPDHRHCYANLDSVHVPLNEEAMEIWVAALVRK